MIRDITYSVNRYGDVTYRLAGKDLLVDENKRVRYIDHDPATIEAGLRLSIQKFGTTLHVRGDEDFKRRVVQVSIERGLRIQFSNPELAAYAKEYEAQLKAQKSVSSAAQSTDLAPQEQAAAQQIGERADNPRSFEQFKQQVQDEARRRAELERQENERQKPATNRTRTTRRDWIRECMMTDQEKHLFGTIEPGAPAPMPEPHLDKPLNEQYAPRDAKPDAYFIYDNGVPVAGYQTAYEAYVEFRDYEPESGHSREHVELREWRDPGEAGKRLASWETFERENTRTFMYSTRPDVETVYRVKLEDDMKRDLVSEGRHPTSRRKP